MNIRIAENPRLIPINRFRPSAAMRQAQGDDWLVLEAEVEDMRVTDRPRPNTAYRVFGKQTFTVCCL